MRAIELLNERVKLSISDDERLQLAEFIVDWLRGTHMGTKDDLSPRWERIHELFPPRIMKPIRLMRLVTLPIEYADQREFHLPRPAWGPVGSWTSTHVGLDSVQGIATELFKNGLDEESTCRMAIAATIAPENILASHQSMRRAFLSLFHDWIDEQPFLGKKDDTFNMDVDYYQSLFRDWKGGPLRQYEYVVRTTPLTVKNIRIYRLGEDVLDYGNDDPHNSGDYRGYASTWEKKNRD